MQQKILIIEDDRLLAQSLRDGLAGLAEIKHAYTIAEAFFLLEQQNFDLVISDRMLPDGDGAEVVSYIHQTTFQTKIIILSNKKSLEDRLFGLDEGADDYLPKPFSISELKIKCKKFLHFDKKKNIDTVTFLDLIFSPTTGEIKIKDKHIKLRKKEATIFNCLLRYKNQILTRNRLIEECWTLDEELPTQTTLDVYIRRLRILLDSYGKYIVTKRGFGYSFTDKSV